MIEMRNIMGEYHIISENPLELFPKEPYMVAALKSASEIMNDCVAPRVPDTRY